MDIGLWIFLGTFIAVPIIIGLVFLIIHIKEKCNNKKLNNYYRSGGKKEIEKLESFMKASNILLPLKNNNDMFDYMSSMLKRTLWHYQDILKKSLEQSGYTKNLKIDKIGTVYYNSKYALIYKDVFFFIIEPSVNNGLSYSYTDENGEKKYWSLQQFFDFCKNLEKTDAYKNLARQIAIKDIHWYVEYPASAGYRLADIGAGAIVGGLAFGAVGALAGAASSSNDQKKSEGEEIEVFWVEKSVRYSIARGDYSSKSAVEKLNEHFPKNRLSDSYKKHF